MGEDGLVNYKAGSQFAQHMQKKTVGVSEFALKNSIAQQRTLLPIYTVKPQLLQVIRDNQSKSYSLTRKPSEK